MTTIRATDDSTTSRARRATDDLVMAARLTGDPMTTVGTVTVAWMADDPVTAVRLTRVSVTAVGTMGVSVTAVRLTGVSVTTVWPTGPAGEVCPERPVGRAHRKGPTA
ncbi:hypothetical protein ACIRQY_05590 [Streptomyces sp. NPDC101490]|uniref:hypothetical protein n=1 Tax=Streptomyces sp. NPDC101490 TaxID=3366143 RepID=UPI003803F375